MPTQIFILDQVPESKLVEIINEARGDDVDVITAINDNHGTFSIEETVVQPDPAGTSSTTITLDGSMSTFGGPDDSGVGDDEGLALFTPADVAANPDLFLPAQPPGTTGLARRLNPQAKYIACRWDYGATPISFLKLPTTLVKVTNPANNVSAMARPADTGPALWTGRIADLSPGLAQALTLDTNQECLVEIPTPAGTQTPPAGSGVAVNVNLAAIDASIFPRDLTRQLVVMTTSNDTTFWVTNQIGPQQGGQSLLRNAANQTKILLSDSTVFPIKVTDQIPAAVAAELNKAAPNLLPPADGTPGPAPQPGDDINAKMFAAAKAFVGTPTNQVNGTEGGVLACAWAVNEVTQRALGKPISTVGAGKAGANGLSTDGIFDSLRANHIKLNSAADAKPGTIIIAPTQGAHHGHVGIVGATTGGVNDTLVYSNSSHSHPPMFQRNYTIGTFTQYFVAHHLQVLFFALNPNQF